jgi:hypothetical protein
MANMSLKRAFNGGPLIIPDTPDFSVVVRTYDPDALAEEIQAGARPVAILESDCLSSVRTKPIGWNIGFRDNKLPPSLQGKPQGGSPAPTPYPKW